jgi:hypothetical protein
MFRVRVWRPHNGGMTRAASDLQPLHAEPDWPAIGGEVTCPLCDYNLRGLSNPRCPECGYAFEWPDVFDPARRRHPYLFEQHPERNVWSFVRTWLANLWPPSFWNALNPTHRSRPLRLLVYWFVATLLGLFVFVAAPVGHVIGEIRDQVEDRARLRAYVSAPNPPPRVRQLLQQTGGVDAYVNRFEPSPFSIGFVRFALRSQRSNPQLLPALFTYVAWPWLTFGVLMLFQGSMRRARVHPSHVLRAVLYACDAALIVGLLMLVALPWADPQVWRPLRYLQVPGSRSLAQLAVSLIILLWTTPRLASALARYLRFDHALAAALSAQIIVLLLVELTAGIW